MVTAEVNCTMDPPGVGAGVGLGTGAQVALLLAHVPVTV